MRYVIWPDSMGRPLITSRSWGGFSLYWGKFCWHTKFSSINTKPVAPVSIIAEVWIEWSLLWRVAATKRFSPSNSHPSTPRPTTAGNCKHGNDENNGKCPIPVPTGWHGTASFPPARSEQHVRFGSHIDGGCHNQTAVLRGSVL